MHLILMKSLKFFFFREFQPMASAPDDALYHQTKTPIGFWYRRGLHPRSLIQLSETLPIELTGTHEIIKIDNYRKRANKLQKNLE